MFTHCDCEENYENHDLVNCIASALDARDPYTGHHSERVSDMACELAQAMGLSAEQVREIHIAAHLHDIGKIGIPDAVLLKPGRLTEEEWQIMKSHSKIGADILRRAPSFQGIVPIVLHHHERFDGRGYPDGIKGEDIPLGARIIAVCDSIDAMASARAYRKALPLAVCRAEIERNMGRMYDPAIAAVALKNWHSLTDIYWMEQNGPAPKEDIRYMETERLLLRPYTAADEDALFSIFSDADTMRYYPSPFTREETQKWMERNQRRYREDGFGLWAVVLKENGQVIGDCGITMQNIHGQMLPEIGYHIHKDHQRKGYATEAARFCAKLAFEQYRFPAVYCYMKHDNWPSMGVAGKMGMVLADVYEDPVNEYTRVFRLSHHPTASRFALAETAKSLALLPLHGFQEDQDSNLTPLVQHFRRWDVHAANQLWCAAFVYHCCIQAGFQLPFSPDECTVGSLACVPAWEELAQKDSRIGYHLPTDAFEPAPGDIVLYDHVFCHQPHDHIGIVIENHPDHILAAEGNVNNTNQSGLVRRAKDHHIRCYIRLPENYSWR